MKDIRRKKGGTLATKLDLDYAYGQIKLDVTTKNLCIFTVKGGDFTGYYRFLKRFYGLANLPTIFQERIDTTFEHKHTAWLDDIIIVTKGSIDEHKMDFRETMKKLEQAGYRLNPKKVRILQKQLNGSDTKSSNKGYEH